MTINELRNLALNKKEKLMKEGENLDKINRIINFLSDDMCFFKVSINLSIPILLYLGISEKNVKNVYFQLIAADKFNAKCSVRKINGK